jgi:hypothetical protein
MGWLLLGTALAALGLAVLLAHRARSGGRWPR